MGHEGIPFLEPGLSGIASIASWGALKGPACANPALGSSTSSLDSTPLSESGLGIWDAY